MANANRLTYIDLSSGVSLAYDGKSFDERFDKKSFIGSRVSYSDVILHSFKVPESMSDEELQTNVEIRMYEDAGLDLQKKYKIAYTKKELDFEDSVLVEAFAVEVQKITDSLSGVLSQSKHIDFLALPFLSFTTLYKNKIIKAKNDIFIFLDEDEAFLSLYKDSKYLSTKSLTNLNEIIKKLELAGVDIAIDELREHLSSKGLDATMYERGESTLFTELETIFSSMLSKINDIVVYNRSVFGFEKVDRIFLSTKSGRIKGLREFIHNFGMQGVEVHDFNLFRDEQNGNFFEKIIASYVYDNMQEGDFRHNLTMFKREPAFYKKESGKILLVASSVVILSLVFVGLLWYENSELQKQKNTLQERYDMIKTSESSYKSKLSSINKELQVVRDKKQSIEKRIDNIDKSISKLEDLRDVKKRHSAFVIAVNRLLKKHSLSTMKIEIVGKNSMHIDIVAQFRKRDSITKFMKDLIDAGFMGIRTDEIKVDNDIYISSIEIKR